MTISEQIKGTKALISEPSETQIELLNSVVESLKILKNVYGNTKSESVIVSMSITDYKQFQDFKNFQHFIKTTEKQEKEKTADSPPEAEIIPAPENMQLINPEPTEL